MYFELRGLFGFSNRVGSQKEANRKKDMHEDLDKSEQKLTSYTVKKIWVYIPKIEMLATEV